MEKKYEDQGNTRLLLFRHDLDVVLKTNVCAPSLQCLNFALKKDRSCEILSKLGR
jgi:hypothetical protein